MKIGREVAKEALFEGFASIGKGLASGRRVEALDLLSQAERSVEEIAELLGQSVANTSHHLRVLAAAGLVRTRREGTRIYYRLASDHVAELWRVLQRVAAEHASEFERLAVDYLGDRSALEVVSRDELRSRLRRGEVTLVDVRPEAEYEAGHIPGARPVAPEEIDRRLRGIPKDRPVVAYCRGAYCVYADEAVRFLRERGYEAARLEDGFPEWRMEGLPVEPGEEA